MRYTELDSPAGASWMHPPPTQRDRSGGPSDHSPRHPHREVASSSPVNSELSVASVASRRGYPPLVDG
eukprot:scaffold47707_cov69-Phaeocystis_antarctica.AAC.2